MIVVGTLAAFLGFCFVVTTLILVLLQIDDARLLRRLRNTPRRTCAELLTPGPLPRSVLLTARTAAGPEGELRSPAYDTACIWYETEVSAGVGMHDVSSYLRLVAGGETIRIEDGTGSAWLDLHLVQQAGTVDRLRRIRSETTPVSRRHPAGLDTGIGRLQACGLLPDTARPRLGQRYLDLREETIAGGLEVTVLAHPQRTTHDESVILRRRGQATTGTADAWIAKLEADRVTSRWIMLVFPLIGLVLIAAGTGLIWVDAI